MNDLPTPENPLRIGTRASPLAMAQAHMAMAALIASHGLDMTALEIVPMTATGDRIQDRALAEVGGKALWKIGRASCRGRVCQYVSISVVAVSSKKKITILSL